MNHLSHACFLLLFCFVCFVFSQKYIYCPFLLFVGDDAGELLREFERERPEPADISGRQSAYPVPVPYEMRAE